MPDRHFLLLVPATAAAGIIELVCLIGCDCDELCVIMVVFVTEEGLINGGGEVAAAAAVAGGGAGRTSTRRRFACRLIA